ncbi:MAG: arylsulfatase A-like enzyme [Planctomycetota bacterium]|jgi:arylsulfatase A-like enzyme
MQKHGPIGVGFPAAQRCITVFSSKFAKIVVLGMLAPSALSSPQHWRSEAGCEALPNSLGVPARLRVSGDATLPGGRLTLEASPLPNQPGIFFYSTDSTDSGVRTPLMDGLSCLGSAGRRVSLLPFVQASGNRIRLEVELDQLAEADRGIHAGTALRFQGWYRDPGQQQLPFNFTTTSQVQLGSQPINILQVLIDDVGMDYLRVYDDQNKFDGDNPLNTLEDPSGKNIYPWTPFIDELASKGIRFNQYRTNPTCSTSRACMISGRYAFRNGVGSLITEDRVGTLGEFGVGPGNDEYTIAEVVGPAGYETGYVGKWHLALGSGQVALGGAPGLDFPHVLTHGKWDFAWSVHANLTNWPFVSPVHIPGVSGSVLPENDVVQGYWNFESWANFGTDPFQTPNLNLNFATELSRLRTKEMIDWMTSGAPGSPWYIFSSFNSAHTPYGDFPGTAYLSTQEYWPAETIYGLTIPGGSGPVTAWTGYCAHLEAMDSRLAAMFNDMGGLDNVLQDTMVLLVGDNGSPPPTLSSATTQHGKDLGSIYPLLTAPGNNHFKHQPYEQGVRVPLIVAGPLVANVGSVSYAPVDAVDIFATVAEMAQADIPSVVNDGRALDGVSFMPLIDGTLDDLTYIKSVRDWSFVERFSPNGDPRLIMPPVDNLNSRRRGYTSRIGDNWFKLIRRLNDAGGETDELYHLYNTEVPSIAGEVDINELNDISGQAHYSRVYMLLVERLETLLATEP